ncbi:dopamine receptor 1 [Dermacentor silvarum]|uniref:dopamine receptor 1 n=1 Tax=Dermacentor silvarum TaxID=543639 RepID=UPI00189779E2|nr:dopamine receptor 1 [Dermacentor silvarum]XP_037569729.1 dopamine receptor 1 [Dermacentor silvarum]XP_049521788.1 dopamine receptor 1 [Dermacentor silvarum]XP_049521789.1 dopamine receptor 1 [Dermacentor silvarum]XP_049521790.1 dopamine receptor 1 [Dermacentor silvarum]XP_049521792.1 dopamine receptor 1 [Dermacentor silvarum]
MNRLYSVLSNFQQQPVTSHRILVPGERLPSGFTNASSSAAMQPSSASTLGSIASVFPTLEAAANNTTAALQEAAVPSSGHPLDSWDLSCRYIIGTFLLIIILTAITGNILVCLAIYTDRRLRKLGNLFLVSLAVADLLVSSLVMTFAVINDLMGYWAFGPQFCDIWIAFDVMCSTASILNLCAISMDRFLHIKDPLGYGRWMTKRAVLGTICGIWMLSALLSFLPISLGWHRPYPDSLLVVNGLTMCALDLTPEYAVTSSLISFYMPCIVMVALYARLYLYARRHVQNIRAVTKPCVVNNKDPGSPTKFRAIGGQSSLHVMDHKAAITLGIIVGVFLCCWVPFFCANIVAAFCKTCISEECFKFLTWLGYLNSALNPIIYSIFNTEFRDAFRRVITAHACCKALAERARAPSDLSYRTKRSTICETPRANSLAAVNCRHNNVAAASERISLRAEVDTRVEISIKSIGEISDI